MPVIDQRVETGSGREAMLQLEVAKAAAVGKAIGFRVTPFVRDRDRNTYGTVPGTAFMVNVDPTEENAFAFLRVMDGLRRLIEQRGLVGAAETLDPSQEGG